jgi:hypothetical protein
LRRKRESRRDLPSVGAISQLAGASTGIRWPDSATHCNAPEDLKEQTMAAVNLAECTDDALHISLRRLMNGRWEVLCDRMCEPLISVTSREAAFEYAVLLAVAHPPTTIDLAG